MRSFKVAFVLALVCLSTFSKTPEEWRGRTIYQLLTDRFARSDGSTDNCWDLKKYCGGTYRGIINHLDYIKGMGFDAIWISPVPENYPDDYHGYAAKNLYKLNPMFGSEQDFVDFVSACHARDIWVMVDVVGNHMGNTDENFSQNTDLNSRDHYHDYCDITDNDFNTYNQWRIENCRLAALADLKQENDYVRTYLLNWVKNLVTKYNLDGLRVDTIPEVPKWFWTQFAQSAGVYTVGEIFNGNMGYVGGYIGTVNSILNYPMYYAVRDVLFNSGDMYALRNYYYNWAQKTQPSNLNYMGNFVDNHDNSRFLNHGGDWSWKVKIYKTAHAFLLTSVGIPIVYYGSEQLFSGGNDPLNREVLWGHMDTNSEMYQYIAKLVAARKKYTVWQYDQIERYCDAEIFAFSRGKLFTAVTSKVGRGVSKYITYHPYSAGEVICNIFYPASDCITVTSSGFQIYLNDGEAKVYVPK